MPTSTTAPSTPRLSEYARHFTYPTGITKTVWPRVAKKGAELGLGFDWWQSQLGTVCLGYGADGKYVATVGGVGLSIPRQVGKTYFVLALLVIMCILFPGLQVVWTAHHLRTSTKTFTALRGMCRRRKVAPHVKAMRAANGEQQVEFVNGSTIMFGARSMGFGRGFDEIDVEVFDEAQILDTKALEDMIAATNQARHEHGALLFFMGTPPRPSDPSAAFSGRRKKAINGKAPNAVWLEVGADPDSDPNDRRQWPRMNPSFPKRTPAESMERLRENLEDDDSWNREGRGIWDAEDDGTSSHLPHQRWPELADADAPRGDDVIFGLEVGEDRRAWIGVAWRRDDGHAQVMLANEGMPLSPPAALVECKRLQSEWGGRVVALKSYADELKDEGVRSTALSALEFAAASGAFEDAMTGASVRHGNQPALNVAVVAAKMRSAGATAERAITVRGAPDVAPVVAVVRALSRIRDAAPPPTPRRLPQGRAHALTVTGF